jgi:hypothetical protein
MSTKGKVITGAIVVVLVFLAGFLPQFLDKRRVQAELEATRANLSTAQRQIAIDEIRRLAGRMLLEASRKNFGTAGEHSTEYFDKLREMVDKPEHAGAKDSLVQLLSLRDPITSGLAQGNAPVLAELQSLMEKTYNLRDAMAGTQ